MIVVVRPWKLPAQTTIFGSATPRTSWPHLRASLIAVSTPSAPVFMGSTRGLPQKVASSAQNGPSWSEWNARLVSVRRPSCASAAAIRPGWRCPKFSAE